MSKLRAKEKVVTTAQIENDGYHCCRWCKWYDHHEGMCINPKFSGVETSSFFIELVEEGRLSDTLNEALHDSPEGDSAFEGILTTILHEWKISDSRVRDFKTAFRQALDQYLDKYLKSVLDTHLSKLVQNVENEMSIGGVGIEDIHTHYCREFW